MVLLIRNFSSLTCSLGRLLDIILFICCVAIIIQLVANYDLLFPAKVQEEEIQISESYLSPERVELKTQLKSLLKCNDKRLIMEIQQHGDNWLLKNYIRGRLSLNMGCTESITFTTIADFTFMGHVETVVKRWLGPISFALFAPGYDFQDTMDAIQYARNCLPESQLIRDYVTFHIYFPKDHMPYDKVPATEEEALKWPYNCLYQAPYTDIERSSMYKSKVNLTYPINVGRNIARKAANTHFILAADIELYPSLDFIDQFLRMAVENVSLVVSGVDTPRVFPVPVFGLKRHAPLPDTKSQMVAMLRNRMALLFQQRICSNCHRVPGHNQWLKSNMSDKMEIVAVAKRHEKYKHWEPFYVSDNKEPDFDERVTWEGHKNKRIQNYAMCLLDYEYHILHPGFLVHAPGIKKNNSKSERRLGYVEKMRKQISYKIIPEYRILYGTNKKCVV